MRKASCPRWMSVDDGAPGGFREAGEGVSQAVLDEALGEEEVGEV